MATSQPKATCIPERELSEDELRALKPQVRSLTVLRLEQVYRDALAHAETAAQFSEKGPDPRWSEIQIRALLGIARCMDVDKGFQAVENPDGPDLGDQGLGVAELRARVDQLLASSSPASSS